MMHKNAKLTALLKPHQYAVVFETMDTNKDGTVDLVELLAFALSEAVQTPQPESTKMGEGRDGASQENDTATDSSPAELIADPPPR